MIIRKNPNLKYAILPKSKTLFLGYKKTNDKNWRYFMMYNKYIGSPVYLYDCTEQANQLFN